MQIYRAITKSSTAGRRRRWSIAAPTSNPSAALGLCSVLAKASRRGSFSTQVYFSHIKPSPCYSFTSMFATCKALHIENFTCIVSAGYVWWMKAYTIDILGYRDIVVTIFTLRCNFAIVNSASLSHCWHTFRCHRNRKAQYYINYFCHFCDDFITLLTEESAFKAREG